MSVYDNWLEAPYHASEETYLAHENNQEQAMRAIDGASDSQLAEWYFMLGDEAQHSLGLYALAKMSHGGKRSWLAGWTSDISEADWGLAIRFALEGEDNLMSTELFEMVTKMVEEREL